MTPSQSSRRIGHLLSLGHSRDRRARGPDRITSPHDARSPPPGPWPTRPGSRSDLTGSPMRWYSIEAAQAGAARLIEAGVTGIVCASDLMALGAIRAAKRAGRSVPAMTCRSSGFDDSFLMNCTEPPLTTVRQPIEPMCTHGHRAAGPAGRRCADPARRAAVRAGARGPGFDGAPRVDQLVHHHPVPCAVIGRGRCQLAAGVKMFRSCIVLSSRVPCGAMTTRLRCE